MPISKRAAGGLSETTGALEGAADAGSGDGMTECKANKETRAERALVV
jgi:hypothetical protein